MVLSTTWPGSDFVRSALHGRGFESRGEEQDEIDVLGPFGSSVAYHNLVDGILARGDRALRIADFELQVGQRFDHRDGAARSRQLLAGAAGDLQPVFTRRLEQALQFEQAFFAGLQIDGAPDDFALFGFNPAAAARTLIRRLRREHGRHLHAFGDRVAGVDQANSIDAFGSRELDFRSLDVELQIGAADQHLFGHFGGQAAIGHRLGANHQLARLRAVSSTSIDLLPPAGRVPKRWLAAASAARPIGIRLTTTFSASPLPGLEIISL